MIYRCSECKSEYKEKLAYCACGNNTFDEIPDASISKKQVKKEIKPFDIGKIISMAFFTISLILSACVWLFLWNVKPNPMPPHIKKVPTSSKNIPNIDKIWDDTPLYQPKTNTMTEPEPQINPKKIQEPSYVEEIFKPREQTPQPKEK